MNRLFVILVLLLCCSLVVALRPGTSKVVSRPVNLLFDVNVSNVVYGPTSSTLPDIICIKQEDLKEIMNLKKSDAASCCQNCYLDCRDDVLSIIGYKNKYRSRNGTV